MFKNPNYTQIPNDLFEKELAKMGYAELKVILAIARQTFGFHRGRVRYSIRKLAKMTGLSPQAVLDGAEQAIAHDYIHKKTDGGVTIWEMSVEVPLEEGVLEDSTGVQAGSTTVQAGRTPSIKESIKEKTLVPETVTTIPVSGNVEKPKSVTPKFLDENISREEIDPWTGEPPVVKKKAKETDQRAKHPAIQAYKAVTQRFPSKALYDKIIRVVGDKPDVRFMHQCFSSWMERSSNPAPYKWLFEWYANKKIDTAFKDNKPEWKPTEEY